MIRFVFAIAFIFSCSSNHDAASPSDLEQVKNRRDAYCASFDPNSVARCDRITFVALMSAACGRDYGLAEYEQEGKWHRDQSHRCYQDGESKSECSFDGYLSVLHAMVSGFSGGLRRMQEKLESSDWVCGEGSEEVTPIKPLKSVIERMSGASFSEDDAIVETGFRGHLLASYNWLRKRIGMKEIPGVYAALYAETPKSPFYAALAVDEAGAVRNLMDFPAPYSQFWGSAPDSTMYAATVAILEGK